MKPEQPRDAATRVDRRSMSLVLFTSDTADAPLRWVLLHEGAVEDTGVAPSLEGFAQSFPEAASLPVQLVLPGDRIAARFLETPARKPAQFKQAAQFALEDDLAAPLEDMHLVVPTDIRDGRGLVVAVPSNWLDGWVAAVTDLGLSLAGMTADFLLLRGGEDETTLLFDDRRLVANIGGAGFASDADFATDVLPGLLEGVGAEQISIYQFGDAVVPNLGDAVPTKIADKDELVALYVRGLADGTYVNFQQGQYAAKKDWFGKAKPWRWAALLAVLCGASWMGVIAADGIRAGNAANDARGEAEALYKQAYPQERIRNLSAQARQKSGTVAPDQASFLSLVSVLTTSIEKIPGITMEEINYRPDGTLEARLRFTIEELGALKASLTKQDISFSESRNPRLDGDRYIGGMTLKSGGAS